MKSLSQIPVLLGLLLLLTCGLHHVSLEVKYCLADQLDADKVLWKHLSYKAKSVVGKVDTDVHLAAVPTAETQNLLISSPQAIALQTSSPNLISITAQSVVDPLVGTQKYMRNQAWFTPNNAKALQRIRFRRGADTWQNIYRFTDKGVYRLRRKPVGANEKNLPPQQWTKVKASFYQYNSRDLGCSAVLEPSALLYFVSAIDTVEQETSLRLCVFNKKQLHLVKIHIGGQQRLKVNYLKKIRRSEYPVKERIDVIKISFQPRSLTSDKAPEELFSFLGLKGDFDIFINKISRVPVKVSGNITPLGKVDILLSEVEFR